MIFHFNGILYPETVQGLELAAEARLNSALACLKVRPQASLSFSGFVVEITLKCSYYKFINWPPSTSVDNVKKDAIYKSDKKNVTTDDESGHSIAFWIEMIEQRRKSRGLAASSSSSNVLHQSMALHFPGRVQMRYHDLKAVTVSDAESAFLNAMIVFSESSELRR